ncbi:MAG: alpha-amylase [Phycisphaerales bacterium]|nr:alpha-amylase [Phycisphaerales bacterium]
MAWHGTINCTMLCSVLGMAVPPAVAQTEWWRDAVFYEVFVRSFADSTEGPLAGDGVGDLRGLTDRLDYLNDGDPSTSQDLGVTALWLMPICQSPSYHGYDVTDYRRVDDEYGTNEDFIELVEAAHDRGVRVIVDMVLNHTSDRHPWFRESLDPASPRHDWYVWSPEPIRADWGGELWHKDPKSGLYYFALFWRGMPDLNLRNEAATAEVHHISTFWLRDLHADGFRLDAARHLIEHWPSVENTDETLAWLRDYRADMKRADPEAFLIGEVWSGTDQIARYIPESLDAGFEFDLAFAIVEGVRDGDAARIGRAIEHVASAYPPGQYATFLANHDMPRTMTTLIAGSKDRAEAAAKAKLAATIQLTLPGIPFIYYGEEIGMTGSKPDPEIRTPMQWTGDGATGGFTSGTPWHALQTDSADVNVEKESGDADSILCRYRDLVRLRRDHDALRRGEVRVLETGNPSLLAIERHAEHETVVVIFNCSGMPVERPEGFDAIPSAPVVLLGDNPRGFPLPPWGSAILTR